MTRKQKRDMKRQVKRYYASPVRIHAKDPKWWPQAIVLTLIMEANAI